MGTHVLTTDEPAEGDVQGSFAEGFTVTGSGSGEPEITPGTTSQYWRGDKTWQTLDADAVGLGLTADASFNSVTALNPSNDAQVLAKTTGTSKGAYLATDATADQFFGVQGKYNGTLRWIIGRAGQSHTTGLHFYTNGASHALQIDDAQVTTAFGNFATQKARKIARGGKSASYTATGADDLIAYSTLSAPRTVTLPDATTVASSTSAQLIEVKDETGNAATSNITIATTGGQTIDGASTAVINTAYGSITFYTNGTNWFTMSNNNTGGGGGSGTVTTASVVSANGFAGTVATATSTPAITISTSVTGLLKGNGTAISSAVAGTDYLNAVDLTANVGSTILPVANGGTGSATQNFVDLTTAQNISGTKTFLAATGDSNMIVKTNGTNTAAILQLDSTINNQGNIQGRTSGTLNWIIGRAGHTGLNFYTNGAVQAVGIDSSQVTTFYGDVTFTTAKNLVLPTSGAGVKIGTGTTQKIGFWNATPVVQQSGNVLTALSTLGLVASPTLAQSDITNLTTDMAAKAPLASPALTGTPTSPTAPNGTNTTQIATTAFVQAAAPLTTKGDILGYAAAPSRVAVGTNGQVLVADSTQSAGIKWATVTGTGDMQAATYDAAGIGQQVVGTTAAQTVTNKRITKRTASTTSSATPTINTDNVDMYLLTAQAADITSFTTNLTGTPTEGQQLWIVIVGTATRAITWGSSFESSTVTLPTTTSGTSRLDVGFVWNSATSKWRAVAVA
jgi:hypothetical protein